VAEILTVPYALPAFISYLREAVVDKTGEAIPVASQVPSVKPAKFIRCLVTNVNRINLSLAEIVVVCECWATTEADAGDFASTVYGLATAVNLADPYLYCPEGSRGTVYGPYPSDDPDSGRPRSVFAVSLRVAVEKI
jgi:hypothetical protein